MKIVLTVGHSLLRNGYYTSADGRPYGGLLEYTYNKNIVGDIATYLRSSGHTVDVIVCPERFFSKSTEEKQYKLSKVNNKGYNLVCELHLNASKYHNAKGCSVLYKSDKGKLVAESVQKSLAKVFKDNGIQKCDNLYMLNGTEPVSIMPETFFCDNAEDCALANKTDVAFLIADGINKYFKPDSCETDKEQNKNGNEEYLFRFRSVVSELNIRSGPGVEYDLKGCITDKSVYTITKTERAKDGGTWGKLRSGIGWVNVGASYVIKV